MKKTNGPIGRKRCGISSSISSICSPLPHSMIKQPNTPLTDFECCGCDCWDGHVFCCDLHICLIYWLKLTLFNNTEGCRVTYRRAAVLHIFAYLYCQLLNFLMSYFSISILIFQHSNSIDTKMLFNRKIVLL
jgi:hypothetical protein